MNHPDYPKNQKFRITERAGGNYNFARLSLKVGDIITAVDYYKLTYENIHYGIITEKGAEIHLWWLEAVNELAPTQIKCVCDLMLLMARGCQCGGS